MSLFWLALALLYFALAIVSLRASATYEDRARHVKPMWINANGRLAIGEAPEAGEVVRFSYWEDLGAYLTTVTWINFAGFILAATAAFWTYLAS